MNSDCEDRASAQAASAVEVESTNQPQHPARAGRGVSHPIPEPLFGDCRLHLIGFVYPIAVDGKDGRYFSKTASCTTPITISRSRNIWSSLIGPCLLEADSRISIRSPSSPGKLPGRRIPDLQNHRRNQTPPRPTPGILAVAHQYSAMMVAPWRVHASVESVGVGPEYRGDEAESKQPINSQDRSSVKSRVG